MYAHTQYNDEFSNLVRIIGKGEISMVNAIKCKSMLLASDVVRALLAVCHQVEVFEVITKETATSGDPDVSESREREPRRPTREDASRQSGGGGGRLVVRKLVVEGVVHPSDLHAH